MAENVAWSSGTVTIIKDEQALFIQLGARRQPAPETEHHQVQRADAMSASQQIAALRKSAAVASSLLSFPD